MTNETRQRIEDGLRDWNNPESQARKRFDSAKETWDRKLQPLIDAITASEKITEADLRIVIH
jgi:hypothetical protein